MNLNEMTSGLPKTDLLYLKEMNRGTADVNVIKVIPEKRTHAYLILDRTIFHPKGGGQPSDRGRIGSTQFSLEVKKAIFNQGVVVHWCKIANGTPLVGLASCELDWPFRHLVMRRHTAAHLVDHCLERTTSMRVETTDSWLDEPCYVGYHGKSPAPEIIPRINELAESMISAGGRVRLEFLTGEQGRSLLANAPNFERLPDLDEIRTVTIEGCAPIPCGGTHVTDIREIGKLTVVRVEDMPDGTFRVHFTVGD
jgi:alanyl-tRNA synthetase